MMVKIRAINFPGDKYYPFGILYGFEGEEMDPQSSNIEYFETEEERDWEFACMIDDGEIFRKDRNFTIG